MPENIEAWWARRQRSKGVAVPYPVGTYRTEWASYPMLVRQYHPDLNRNITLTQIPPAADVYLTWQCDSGHIFVATPEEQRGRPGRARRRSVWCPVCTDLAVPRRALVRPAPDPPAGTDAAPASAEVSRRPSGRRRSAADGRPRAQAPSAPNTSNAPRAPGARQAQPTPNAPHERFTARVPGVAFRSPHAPKPASAAEADLRQRLAARLEVDHSWNAVSVSHPFFDRNEVWPDIVIAEFRVAIEYDTVGRFGLEHVGPREESDRRKDRLLRASGWEVVRIRCGPLQPLGAYDLVASGVTDALIARIIETLRDLRGDLFVNAYLR